MIEHERQLHFFIGKGGVGKSTLSSLAALAKAEAGQSVCLVSLDPAHNLSDIFGCRLSPGPRPIADGLRAVEIDLDQWIRRYLVDTRSHLQRTYRYQQAFNLPAVFDILRYSPGLEAYALLLAFQHMLASTNGDTTLIFDMPPTALSLQFFSLPLQSLHWLTALMDLRRDICRNREIISRIRLGRTTIEQDKVKVRLAEMITQHEQLRDRFRAKHTHIHLVTNPEPLSVAEAQRIRSGLEALGLSVDRVVVNKFAPAGDVPVACAGFEDRPVCRVPLSPRPLCGIRALADHLRVHGLPAFRD